MWTVFKVFIEFVTILLLFCGGLGVFGCKGYENLAPRPGIKPSSPTLGGQVHPQDNQGSPCLLMPFLFQSEDDEASVIYREQW